MIFNNELLDKIKEQVDLAELIGKKVSWDQKKSRPAKNDFWAPCPFHTEKTASFHVDNNKGFYYCFGCHAKGNCFKFIQETEKVNFYEAVLLIANQYGISLPKSNKEDKKKNDYLAKLSEIMKVAVNFYKNQLNSIKGIDALNYLRKRKLNQSSIDEFEIGWATKEKNELYKFLKQKGYKDKIIFDAGLCNLSEIDSVPYDRFRNRIIFPIYNTRGNPIAFGGRSLDVNAKAKYLNSPETELFDKSQTLYNLKKAKDKISKNEQIILVEGYMDVILLSQAGFGTAVATLGTAINEKQIEMIWKISKEPNICFDGDSAGKRAEKKIIEITLPILSPEKSLRFCKLPYGKDPDDIINNDGVDKMKKVIANSVPLVKILWDNLILEKNFDSPERKKKLDNEIKYYVSKINDRELSFYFKQDLMNKKNNFLFKKNNNFEVNKNDKGFKKSIKNDPIKETKLLNNKDEKLIEIQNIEGGILLGLINHPKLISSIEDKISKFQFSANLLNHILDTILNLKLDDEENHKSLLKKFEEKANYNPLIKLNKFTNLHLNPKVSKSAKIEEAEKCIFNLILLYEEKKNFEKEIENAKKNIISSNSESKIENLYKINKKIRELQKGEDSLISVIDEVAENEKNELELLIKNKIWKKPKK